MQLLQWHVVFISLSVSHLNFVNFSFLPSNFPSHLFAFNSPIVLLLWKREGRSKGEGKRLFFFFFCDVEGMNTHFFPWVFVIYVAFASIIVQLCKIMGSFSQCLSQCKQLFTFCRFSILLQPALGHLQLQTESCTLIDRTFSFWALRRKWWNGLSEKLLGLNLLSLGQGTTWDVRLIQTPLEHWFA